MLTSALTAFQEETVSPLELPIVLLNEGNVRQINYFDFFESVCQDHLRSGVELTLLPKEYWQERRNSCVWATDYRPFPQVRKAKESTTTQNMVHNKRNTIVELQKKFWRESEEIPGLKVPYENQSRQHGKETAGAESNVPSQRQAFLVEVLQDYWSPWHKQACRKWSSYFVE